MISVITAPADAGDPETIAGDAKRFFNSNDVVVADAKDPLSALPAVVKRLENKRDVWSRIGA